MTLIPLITALTVSALLGYACGDGPFAFIAFITTGLLSGALALFQPKGAERFYWLFVVLIIGLSVASYLGASVHRFAFILPLVFIISYFFARLTRKIGGQSKP
jgi:hypothetical protein